jgi:predicted  nucleic acid-binding Zn-ribbon protein
MLEILISNFIEKMKFLLSILVIIVNLDVLLANNDNCRENDLNALMVRLRQLRTEFNNLKIQHDDRIDQINATQAVLKEANDTQETELKKLRQEFHNTSSELEKLREEFHNTSSELEKLREEFHNTSSELEKLRRNTSSEIAAIKGILLKYLI